jgi:hypothetical protein
MSRLMHCHLNGVWLLDLVVIRVNLSSVLFFSFITEVARIYRMIYITMLRANNDSQGRLGKYRGSPPSSVVLTSFGKSGRLQLHASTIYEVRDTSRMANRHLTTGFMSA